MATETETDYLNEEIQKSFSGLKKPSLEEISSDTTEEGDKNDSVQINYDNSSEEGVKELVEDDGLLADSCVYKMQAIPIVDAAAIETLESRAKELESNLCRMMNNLRKHMNGISCTSVGYAECYRDSVKNIGNVTDTSTKAMAKLIGKCEEMNRSMEPLYSMGEQIKEIKSLLDQFEEICK